MIAFHGVKTARVCVLAASTSVLALGAAHAQDFSGVSVNIMTFTGPQIAEPLQRRAPDFEAATGAEINVVTK